MRKRIVTVTCTILLVISMLVSNTSAVPSKGHHHGTEKLTIDQPNGQQFVEYLNLSGTSIFPASELSWSISEIIPELVGNHNIINQSNIFEQVTVEDNVWHWELSIYIGDLNCSCDFSIIHQHNDNSHQSNILVYLGESNHFPIIEHIPSFQSPNDDSDVVLKYAVTWPSNDNGLIEGLNISLFKAEICLYSGEACVSNPFSIELPYSVQNDGFYMIQINQEEIQISDGNWLFNIIYRDSYLRTSNLHSKVLTFDSNPPNVTIFGDQNTTEMSQTIYSVLVDDGYDSSSIAITWTLANPDGDIRALFSSEIIDDYSAKISFNKSGSWSISVLAIDSVGHYTRISHVVDVENTPPTISIDSIDEINSDMTFDISSDWYLDASNSVDTENDHANLIFQWYVDESMIYSGMNLSQNVLSKPGSYEINLIITDDDGDKDEYQFLLTLEQYSETTENAAFSPVIVGSISFIAILILVSLIFTLKRSNGEFKLPKWKN
ncbi:MAG: hypothetical protein HON10_02970 [Euryarchaeota archaeon]|jgi:hypothetical protein|nr:hypothetical protein [Euryarchaeota archaeon]